MYESTKTAVVTGATGGIGRSVCLRLALSGFDIIGQYRSNPDRAQHLSAEIQALGTTCSFISADLSIESDIDDFVSAVDEQVEPAGSSQLTALVNNAGKLLGPSFSEATFDQFDEYFAINTRAPFFLAQKLSQRMINGGSIVNISSASAHFSSPGDIVYAMSKAAIEALTRNMAEAVAEHGIRVNTVIPGFTDNGHAAFSIPEIRAYMSSFAVLGDVTSPDTVAEAVEFLVSDRSSRTTGTSIDVTGGSLLAARGTRAHGVRDVLKNLAARPEPPIRR